MPVPPEPRRAPASGGLALGGVVFDLDDTLTDHLGVEAEVWNEIAAAVLDGMPGVDPEELRTRYDANLEPFYARFLAEEVDFDTFQRMRLTDAVEPWGDPPDDLMHTYLAFKRRMMEEVRPAEGSADALAAVRAAGLAIGVLTNGPIDLQRMKLRRIGFENRVDAMLTSEEIGASKPDPRAFEAIAAAIDVAPTRLAMVGDSPENDIHGALGADFAAAVLVPGRPRSGELPSGAIEVDSIAAAPAALGIEP